MATIVAPKLTYWDLLRRPDDGKQYQIIDGEAFMSPSPNEKHQRAVGNLHLFLRLHCDSTRAGKIYLAPFDVVFDEFNVLQPDLLFVRKERLSIITTANVFGVPDLAIEVLSPSTAKFDRETKLRVYARAGVPELWYVDPESETVEVLNPTPEGHSAVTQRAAGDELLKSSVLPSISLTTRQISA